MTTQRIIRSIVGIANAVVALGLVGVFLVLTGLLDGQTIATAGATHAVIIHKVVGAIHWDWIVTGAVAVVVVVTAFLLRLRIQKWMLMNREVKVKLVD